MNKEFKIPASSPKGLTKLEILKEKLKPLIGNEFILTGKSRTDGSNTRKLIASQLDMDRLRNYERNGQIASWNIRGPRDARPLYWDMPYFHSYENLRYDYKNATCGKVVVTYEFSENINAVAEIRSTFNSYSGNDRGTTKSLDQKD